MGWPRSHFVEGGEGEALTCLGFQGIPGPGLVGGAGEKPLQVSGSPPFFSWSPSACTTPNSPSRGPCLKSQKMQSLYGFPSYRETKPQTNMFL